MTQNVWNKFAKRKLKVQDSGGQKDTSIGQELFLGI